MTESDPIPMTPPDLEGAVALVTGAGSGLGAAIAADLASRGCRVAIADIADPVGDIHPGAFFVHTDVADEASITSTVDAVVGDHGRLDILVNCAAIWFRKPFLEIDAAEWDTVNAVNLRGPFLLCRAVAPVMQEQGSGTIVNIASQAGITYTRGQGAHYAASKAGLIQLTRVLAFELGGSGVRINAVAPGRIVESLEADEAAVAAMPEAVRASLDRLRGQTPLGRFATVAEVVSAVSFLCSSGSSGMTGQTLVVNGGALSYV